MNSDQLRDDVTIKQLIDNLNIRAQEAANVANSSPGRSALDMARDYLGWAETAERMLRNVLTVEAVAAMIYTDRYWVIARSRGDEPRAISMILAELRDQDQALTELANDLAKQHNHRQYVVGAWVVPDTNVFLRPDTPLAAIDWPTAMDSRVDIHLVVPLIVIHELDRLKRQGNNTTAKQARGALRWLTNILPRDYDGRSHPWRDQQPATTIEAYVHEGPSRPDDADGLIIDVVKWLNFIIGRPVTLVTYDLGMRLRANAAGVRAIQLPDVDS